MADSKFVTTAAGYPYAFGICSVSMENTNFENKTMPSDTQWRIDDRHMAHELSAATRR
jgi:hypothetical protein